MTNDESSWLCFDVRTGIVPSNAQDTSSGVGNYESDIPEEAAEIANQVVEVYRTSSLAPRGPDGKPRMQILDKAQPNPRPARPNKPLNIAIGLAIGGVLGATGLALIFGSFRKPKPAPAC